jgi:flagellar biosynthesis/type III secretory pathway protein FliH
MSEQDKHMIEKELKMQFNYDVWVNDDPIIQSMLAERELKGKTEGRDEGLAEGKAAGRDEGLAEGKAAGRDEGLAWGEIKATQESILSLLTARFSAALATQAQPVVAAIQSIDVLKMLFQQLLRLPDEQTVRIALHLSSE